MKKLVGIICLILLCAVPALSVQMHSRLDPRVDPEDSPTFVDLILSGGNIMSAASINLKPSGDTDSYLSFSTVVNKPTVTVIGGANLWTIQAETTIAGFLIREDDNNFLNVVWTGVANRGLLQSSHELFFLTGNNSDITLSPHGTGVVNINSDLDITPDGAKIKLNNNSQTLSISASGSMSSSDDYTWPPTDAASDRQPIVSNASAVLRFGDLYYSQDESDALFLQLDQTTPQTIANGVPLMTTSVDGEGSQNQLVNKEYVDLAVSSLELSEFFHNDPDALGGLYFLMDETEDTSGSVVSTGVPSGVAVNIFNFLTPDGKPGLDRLVKGIYDCHVHISRSASVTRDVEVHYELYKRASIGTGGAETLLGVSESQPITTVPTEHNIHLVLDADEMILTTNRLLIKWHATVTGTGGVNPTITMDTGGEENSHFSVNVNALGLSTIYVPQSLATASNDFIVASGAGVFAKKTLAETGAILEGDIIHDNLQSVHQSVTSGSAPTFTADNFSDGGSNAIITTTQETNFEAAFTHVSNDGSDHSLLTATAGTAAASKAWILGISKQSDTVIASTELISGDINVEIDPTPVTVDLISDVFHYWRGKGDLTDETQTLNLTANGGENYTVGPPQMFLFNDTDYHEAVGYKGILGSSARSFSFLMRMNGTAARGIFGYGNRDDATGSKYLQVRVHSTNDVLELQTGLHTLSESNAWFNGILYHVIVVIPEGATLADIKIYRDGQEVSLDYAGPNINNEIATESDYDFVVGAQARGNNPFDGDISDFAEYDVALTPTEALALYNGQRLATNFGGGISVANTITAGGTISTSSGNITTTSGTIRTSSGNISTTSGDIFTSGGDVRTGGDVQIGAALDHNGTEVGFYGAGLITRQTLAADPTNAEISTVLLNLGLVELP